MMIKQNELTQQKSVFDTICLENRKHISEELFDKLQGAILSGELPAGYVFPNENDLCQKLNIGRGSLREAYSCLETLHLITRTKTGTYVNSQNIIQNTMNFVAIAQRSETQNLIEYRRIVEVGTVQLATEKVTTEDLAKLDRILAQMETAGDDAAKLSQYDFDFHSAIVNVTGNELLIIAFNTIRSIYEDFTESVFERGYFTQSLTDHHAILGAMRAGDPARAGLMMRQHLEHVESFRHDPDNISPLKEQV